MSRAGTTEEVGGVSSPSAAQKRKEAESQPSMIAPEGTTGDTKRLRLAPPAAGTLNSQSAWLAAEEANAPMAPDPLVDELLRTPGLFEK